MLLEDFYRNLEGDEIIQQLETRNNVDALLICEIDHRFGITTKNSCANILKFC